MMKIYKNTYQNTLIASGKDNLEELAKLTILNILSVKGVIYTHYKNKKLNDTPLSPGLLCKDLL